MLDAQRTTASLGRQRMLEEGLATHKWTFSSPFPLPNFGRSFIVANDQLATLDIH